MRHLYRLSILSIVILLTLTACKNSGSMPCDRWNTPVPARSVYYWKTVFDLSEREQAILTQQQIERIYIRLFDVDFDTDFDGEYKPLPIATTRFNSDVPEGVEVVPVVFITNEAMRSNSHFELPLYRRIKSMCGANRLGHIREIQIDCDWSETTQAQFFAFCDSLHTLAHADSITLSATIRLHQLRLPAPPVDRGSLMLYNMGSIYDSETDNSILSLDEASKYLSRSITYGMPLSLALPTFSWAVHFRGAEFEDDEPSFMRILPRESFENNKTHFRQIGSNRYQASEWVEISRDNDIYSSDMIRLEKCSYPEIMQVKQLATEKIESPICGTILYHLDETNLSEYTEAELTEMLK